MNTIRIFISSPGDVIEERVLSQRVIERLQEEFIRHVVLEPIYWEHKPLRATASFQEQIPRTYDKDICVFILWARLGTPVKGHDGERYESGTEYEFIDAQNGYRERGLPDLLVYRKKAKRLVSLDEDDENIREYQKQKRAVEAFVERWFLGEDGSYKAAFHEFDGPVQLEERFEQHLRELIKARLPKLAAAEFSRVWQKGSPFRGLELFDFEHARIFCGRTAAIHDVLNKLRLQAAENHPFVLVVGMSGTGKSSLVRAGVLPMLTHPDVIEGVRLWRRSVLRPGDKAGDLLDGLAAALIRDDALPRLTAYGTSEAELAGLLRGTPHAVPSLLRRELAQYATELQTDKGLTEVPEARLILVVDQLEEIFSLSDVTPTERESFMAAISALARSGAVWVIATLRADFYPRCGELPELMALKENAGQYDLGSPTPAEISRMICQPAEMAGLRFEERQETQEQLNDVLCAAAGRDVGAIPLLEFTLEQLYQRHTEDGLLTFKAYDELGGLEGSLATHADKTFSSLTPGSQATLSPVLSSVATVGMGKDEKLARRQVPLAQLAKTPESKGLVDAFVDARLFVIGNADDGTPVVSVAHEALLHHWPRAQAWQEENKDFLQQRARLGAATALWQAEQEAPNFLLPSGKFLDEAQTLLVKRGGELDPSETAFIQASVLAANKRRQARFVWRAAAAASVLVLLAAGAVYWDFYYRKHIEYYENFVMRWNKPEGIGPVSAEQASHRASVLKFVQQGRFGLLERILVVNGKDECPKPPVNITHASSMTGAALAFMNFSSMRTVLKTDEIYSSGGWCAYVFTYDRNATLTKERAISADREIMYELEYRHRDLVAFKGSKGFLKVVDRGATYARLIRVESENPHVGLIRRVAFVGSDGSPERDAAGSYGRRIDNFNPQGLPRRIWLIDANGTPHDPFLSKWLSSEKQMDRALALAMSNMVAAAGTDLSYDPHGRLKRLTFIDSLGEPLQKQTEDDSATIATSFDLEYYDNGNLSDINTDVYIRDSAANYKVRFEYDDNGGIRAVEQALYGHDGALLAVDGEVKTEEWYDHHGNVVKRVFYGTDNELVLGPEGFAKLTAKYDKDGNVIRCNYLNDKNQRLHAFVSIAEVFPGSQAERIALRPGDIIVKYNGRFVPYCAFPRAVAAPGEMKRQVLIVREKFRDNKVFTRSVAPGLLGVRIDPHVPPAERARAFLGG